MLNMPGQSSSPSPFEVISASKPKKGNRGLIIGILVGIFLILSVAAGVILVRQQQNVQEKAQTTPDFQNDVNNCGNVGMVCPIGDSCIAGVCTAAATASPTATAFPTASPTATPSGTLDLLTDSQNCGSIGIACALGQSCISGICSSSATSSSTPLPTLQVQTTPRPVPVTGIDWPTMFGVGGGAAAIIFAVLLAI